MGLMSGNPYYAGNPFAEAVNGFQGGMQGAQDRIMAKQLQDAEIANKLAVRAQQQQLIDMQMQAAQRQQAEYGREMEGQQAIAKLFAPQPEMREEAGYNLPPGQGFMATMAPQMQLPASPVQRPTGNMITPQVDARTLAKTIAPYDPKTALTALMGAEKSDAKLESLREMLTLKQEFTQQMAEAKNTFEKEKIKNEYDNKMSLMEEKFKLLKDVKIASAGGGRGGGGQPNVKLKQGEVLDPLNGEVRAVKGSDLYIKQSGLHAKDSQALGALESSTDNALSTIRFLLSPENKSAFNSNFGGYNAYVTNKLPGKTQDIKAKINTLKSNLKKAGLDIMRSGGSIGQMTVAEWPIVEQAISSIDPLLGEDRAREELSAVAAYLESIKNKAQTIYDDEWGSTQYYKKRGGGGQPDASTAVKMIKKYGSKQAAMDAWARGER